MEIFGLSEPAVRLSIFGTIFLVLALFELWSPRLERPELMGALKARRWFTNLSILIISSLALRVVFPIAAVGTALWASDQGYGFLPWIGLNPIGAGLIAFVILDLAVWFEHLLSHKIPLIWRIHRMHHADTGFDVTTALRFHPIEILLSMFWKATIIIVLGAPALAVLIFEVVLNSSSMFNHANLKLPGVLDRTLRLAIVTPDMHRVHHSTERIETDSNYGFNFVFWDRLFRTYRREAAKGQADIEIGQKDYLDERPSQLGWSLLFPFMR